MVRSFCGGCGTPIAYQHDDSPETIELTTATLDEPERCAPTREIWLEHKLPWTPLDPLLVHYSHDSDGDARPR